MSDLRNLLLSADPVAELRAYEASNDLGDLEPTLAALSMEIPRGYHHKDNWEHSIRVVGNALEREQGAPDLVLRTAALFHDIGKPDTRRFEGKGVVTFRNHETVGAKIVRKILPKHGYSKAEIRRIERLVALHMRGYGFGDVKWSDSAVRRLITDAGSQEALDQLIIVFYSDLTTKNERKKRKVEGAVARLEEALAMVRAKDERRALRPAIDGNELMALTGMKPGRELGQLMQFLNSDEGVVLSRAEALLALEQKFDLKFNRSQQLNLRG